MLGSFNSLQSEILLAPRTANGEASTKRRRVGSSDVIRHAHSPKAPPTRRFNRRRRRHATTAHRPPAMPRAHPRLTEHACVYARLPHRPDLTWLPTTASSLAFSLLRRSLSCSTWQPRSHLKPHFARDINKTTDADSRPSSTTAQSHTRVQLWRSSRNRAHNSRGEQATCLPWRRGNSAWIPEPATGRSNIRCVASREHIHSAKSLQASFNKRSHLSGPLPPRRANHSGPANQRSNI
jgi:hypothetical protein